MPATATYSSENYYSSDSGTASQHGFEEFKAPNLIPLELYRYNYSYRQEIKYNLLQHEAIVTTSKKLDFEPLIFMPVVKKIGVKICKPSPLEFYSIENNEGFIE